MSADSFVFRRDFITNRNRMDIVATILTTCKDGCLKTHVIYKANQSYLSTTAYLDDMRRAGLLEKIERDFERPIWKTTSKGLKFLEHYEIQQALLKDTVEVSNTYARKEVEETKFEF
ncbi:MAG: winged helix-turn-helix domain-containing protein [Nitrososphaerales archaeon]